MEIPTSHQLQFLVKHLNKDWKNNIAMEMCGFRWHIDILIHLINTQDFTTKHKEFTPILTIPVIWEIIVLVKKCIDCLHKIYKKLFLHMKVKYVLLWTILIKAKFYKENEYFKFLAIMIQELGNINVIVTFKSQNRYWENSVKKLKL